MGLDRVVEVDETQQAELATLAIFKRLLLMPHLHNGADHAFGLAVGLGPIDAGKLLTNTEFSTGFDEGMIANAFELLAVV